jgi:hypothetical protein
MLAQPLAWSAGRSWFDKLTTSGVWTLRACFTGRVQE